MCHVSLAKLLAVIQFTLRGTPFVFQGDEMGLANYAFTSMEQITDVEAKGYYGEHIRTESREKAFATILAGTREHARIPLPWNRTVLPCHAGLHQEPKAEVTAAYRSLIELRKNTRALVYGDFKVVNRRKDRFAYERTLDGECFLVDCNLGEKPCRAQRRQGSWEKIYDTADQTGTETSVLAGYEACIWRRINS